MFGVGGRFDLSKARLDAAYTYTRGRTSIGYSFNAAGLGLATSGAPTALQQTTLGLIGDGFSDIAYDLDAIDVSVVVPMTRTTSVRLIARHEIGKVRDWHYDGVASNPAPATNQQVYLDSGPQDYKATLLGILLKVDF